MTFIKFFRHKRGEGDVIYQVHDTAAEMKEMVKEERLNVLDQNDAVLERRLEPVVRKGFSYNRLNPLACLVVMIFNIGSICAWKDNKDGVSVHRSCAPVLCFCSPLLTIPLSPGPHRTLLRSWLRFLPSYLSACGLSWDCH